jgi:hypothetical protein
MRKKTGSNNSLNTSNPALSMPSSPSNTITNTNFINNSVTSSIIVTNSIPGTQRHSMAVTAPSNFNDPNYPLPPLPDPLKGSVPNLAHVNSKNGKPLDANSKKTTDIESVFLKGNEKPPSNVSEKIAAIHNSNLVTESDDEFMNFESFQVSLPNPITEPATDSGSQSSMEDKLINNFYLVTAVFDYTGTEKEELSFMAGEKMKVFPEKSIQLDDGTVVWYWTVKDSGEFGFIPSNYVEYEESTSRLVSMYEETVPEMVRKVCSYIEEKGN